MKTIKYNGEEYQVLDLMCYDSERCSDLDIVAGLKDRGVTKILHFKASYFKRLDSLDYEYETKYYSRRVAEVVNEFAKAN